MSLEACYIIIDSSEYMRNGDFSPNRFEAQMETINLLANAKTSAHPESTVGLMTMSGKRPEVLVTLGNDPLAIQSCLSNIEVAGKSDLLSAIQVAQLALKHRQNKNGAQRIVVFVGSTLEDSDAKTFERVGARLKKNNICMDIVGLLGSGDDEKGNKEKLTALHKGVNKGDTSNLILLEPSYQIIADVLLSGPLFGNKGGAGGVEGGMGAVDPNIDPEYALAIQLSLQEQEGKNPQQNTAATTTSAPANTDDDGLDEETRHAIALSMQIDEEEAKGNKKEEKKEEKKAEKKQHKKEDEMDHEEEAARQLSLELTEEADNEKKEVSEALKDVSVDDLFGTLPGVTTDSEHIQNALKNIKGEGKKDNKKDKKDENMDTSDN